MKTVLVIVFVENFPTGENYNNYESVPRLRAPPYSRVYVQALVRLIRKPRRHAILTRINAPLELAALSDPRSFVNIHVIYLCAISQIYILEYRNEI